MSINRILLMLWLGFILAACSSNQVKIPEKVYITVEKYIPIPEEYTKDCPIAQPKELTVAEAVRVAKARKVSLEQCNVDKEAIRKINGELKEKGEH